MGWSGLTFVNDYTPIYMGPDYMALCLQTMYLHLNMLCILIEGDPVNKLFFANSSTKFGQKSNLF